MDISALQQRIVDFSLSQMTNGPSNTAEAEALRRDLDTAIDQLGDTLPELQEIAKMLDLMAEVADDPDLAAHMAEAAQQSYEPNPPIFDAIDDADTAAVVAALDQWDINAMHGEFQSTALYHATSCMCGVSPTILHLLLDRGADPNLGLGTARNVLHGLGFGRCDDVDPNDLAEVVKRCVAKGADIEQRSDKLLWTPLITAASEWNPVAVEALILAGADSHARAGEVDGVCFAGSPARSFAEGHPATTAVLDRYRTPS